jgi:hypothetical protein
LIYELCDGRFADKDKILKTFIPDALDYFYLQRLKRLNEYEGKIVELKKHAEQMRNVKK